MQTVTVELGANPQGDRSRAYNIYVGPGLIEEAGRLLKDAVSGHKAVIITDITVKSLYGDRLKGALGSAGFDTSIIQIPPGEGQKSLETAALLYDKLTELHAERTTTVVALGGGVIGDLAGFVAATYMRGVPLVQVPTTLLAQGDSSIGGKVAVNHGNLKNRIGTFYHPTLTISDTGALRTLSKREISDGLAEIIKHGIILDKGLFSYIEENMDRVLSVDQTVIEIIVAKSASIKAGIVARDELDLGLRNVLNYGHTVGHAVESVSKLTIWHGEAVAIGMVSEARIAESIGTLEAADVSRIEAVLKSSGLPTEIPSLSRAELMEAMQHDKKTSHGKLLFALPKGIGQVTLTNEVDASVIGKVLEGHEKT